MASKLLRGASFAVLSGIVVAAAGCAAATNPEPSSSVEALGEGPVLLVSDIDDTIRRTDVLNKAAAAVHVLDSGNAFGGMAKLYADWRSESPSTHKLTYLSAAPAPVLVFSKHFLHESGFVGDTSDVSDSVVGGRSLTESAGAFKTRKLLEMYDKQVATDSVPAAYILVGDNGEQDMIAYQNFIDYVASKGGETSRIYSFIHHVYDVPSGSPIVAPHRPWVTAADFAVQLQALKLVGEAAVRNVSLEVAREGLAEDDSVIIPRYMSCTQFTAWPTAPSSSASGAYAAAEAETKALCARSGN